MKRRVLNLLTALSLLLCVAACVLWVRSYRGTTGAGDHVSAYLASFKGRHTVRAERGRLTLYAPPTVPPLSTLRRPKRRDGATAEALVSTLRNDQVEWEVILWTDGRAASFLSPRTEGEQCKTLLFGYPTIPGRRVYLPWFPKAEIGPPLLRALERPDQFLAAHVALLRVYPQAGQSGAKAPVRRGDGTLLDDADGVRAVLTPEGPSKPLRSNGDDPAEFEWPAGVRQLSEVVLYSCSARVDPAALRRVRDEWHRRLDVPAGSAPLWPVATGAAVLPLVRGGYFPVRRRLLARARRRRGLCPACAYDLRATPARCPECGAVPTGGSAT